MTRTDFNGSRAECPQGGTEKSNGRALARFKWMAAANRVPNPVHRAVLISIGLQYSLDDGCCNSGYDKIAAGTSYKRRAVITAVGEMAIAGWIEIEQSRGRHRNSIKLAMPSNSASAGAPLGSASAPLRKTANSARQERQQCTVGASNSARRNSHVIDAADEKNHIRYRDQERDQDGTESVASPSPQSNPECVSVGAEEAPPPHAPEDQEGPAFDQDISEPYRYRPNIVTLRAVPIVTGKPEIRPAKLALPDTSTVHVGPWQTKGRSKTGASNGHAGKRSQLHSAVHKTLLPDGWVPTDRIEDNRLAKFPDDQRKALLAEILDAFKIDMRANGEKKPDWNARFAKYVRCWLGNLEKDGKLKPKVKIEDEDDKFRRPLGLTWEERGGLMIYWLDRVKMPPGWQPTADQIALGRKI
jgi:hypothetical protein